ncbi:HIT family protein [Xylocopilactobacillus apis]|uniref:HIT family protein n=1 Tax=Xylocopilactobacillus apis TaxID=2932183 RepID=A0AAU9CY41_9LACO|nr:HIT family protein [Xylocopilactobacillus apis]BDR57351.1 HIT family protein [Xylocopilactobacillus apis]
MCEICHRIDQIKSGTNKYLVRELNTGYVVIGDHQYFKGYTLFLFKEHQTELFHLPKAQKLEFLNEMSLVAEACSKAFNADKINYELLGNGDTHLHWHLFARRKGDLSLSNSDVWPFFKQVERNNPASSGPVWWLNPEIMYAEDNEPNDDELSEMKNQLNLALDEVLKQEKTLS